VDQRAAQAGREHRRREHLAVPRRLVPPRTLAQLVEDAGRLAAQPGCLDKTRVRDQTASVWARKVDVWRANRSGRLLASLPLATENPAWKPGQDIVAAEPFSFNADGWGVLDGTSFSAPMVAAATAWVWTARRNLDHTQIFDLMRYSAKDIWKQGFDPDTGFGLLNIPAALSAQALPVDPHEPNEDIFMIKRNGLFRAADPPLTRPGHGSSNLSARLDYTEDPEDVYRVFVPGRRTAQIRVQGGGNVDLEVWRPGTKSVYEKGAALRRDLIGSSTKKGTRADAIIVRNSNRLGGYIYADVFLGKDASDAAYRIKVTTSR
jgi:Subtilase family